MKITTGGVLLCARHEAEWEFEDWELPLHEPTAFDLRHARGECNVCTDETRKRRVEFMHNCDEWLKAVAARNAVRELEPHELAYIDQIHAGVRRGMLQVGLPADLEEAALGALIVLAAQDGLMDQGPDAESAADALRIALAPLVRSLDRVHRPDGTG